MSISHIMEVYGHQLKEHAPKMMSAQFGKFHSQIKQLTPRPSSTICVQILNHVFNNILIKGEDVNFPRPDITFDHLITA